jgi:hypothetical protein
MVNWKGFERKRSWPTRDIIPEFVWKEYGKSQIQSEPQTSTERYEGVYSDRKLLMFRRELLPPTSEFKIKKGKGVYNQIAHNYGRLPCFLFDHDDVEFRRNVPDARISNPSFINTYKTHLACNLVFRFTFCPLLFASHQGEIGWKQMLWPVNTPWRANILFWKYVAYFSR